MLKKPWGAIGAGWGEALCVHPLPLEAGHSQYRFGSTACAAASSIQISSNSVFPCSSASQRQGSGTAHALNTSLNMWYGDPMALNP